jgi:hypothetical protein
MPTKPDKTGHFARELSVAKSNAIDLIVSGSNDQEAAESVGMTRQTVNGWRNHDPDFIAALNARRLDLWSGAVDKLRSLLPTALTTLEAALIDRKDWRAAAAIVELAGLDRHERSKANLGPYSIGPTDAEAVVDALARARRRDPLGDLLTGGSVTEGERREVLVELAAKRAASESAEHSGG